MVYIIRKITKPLEKLIMTRPLVYLNGPRQVGKSTLVHHLPVSKEMNYVSFDSPFELMAAKNDPVNFLDSLPKDKLNIIDEVQMCPEIFNYLKIAVDSNRLQSHNSSIYLLTGSANLLALPKLSEALVGRMSIITLLPFSAGEYLHNSQNFIEKLFADNLTRQHYPDYNILEYIHTATYPEIAINLNINRPQWFNDYLTTILQRDVKNLADIRNPNKMLMLLGFLAMRCGGLINNSAIAAESGLDNKTYDKYKTLLLNTFLIFELKPWTTIRKINKRFTKSAKFYFTDTNMLGHVLHRELQDIYQSEKTSWGHILENFIATELLKNTVFMPEIQLSHFHTDAGKEVDFVVEQTNGELIGIEVKAAKTVKSEDFSGLIELQTITQTNFNKGIVLYLGNDLISFGNKLWAVPICYLWS